MRRASALGGPGRLWPSRTGSTRNEGKVCRGGGTARAKIGLTQWYSPQPEGQMAGSTLDALLPGANSADPFGDAPYPWAPETDLPSERVAALPQQGRLAPFGAQVRTSTAADEPENDRALATMLGGAFLGGLAVWGVAIYGVWNLLA